MPEQQMHDVVLRATLGDCCSGLIRLVDDVQRFGLQLRTLILARGDDEAAVATISLSIPCSANAGFIATRLARHPSVASVEVQRDCSAPQSLLHASLLQTQVDRGPVAEHYRSVVSHTG
jgi:hypothetical protein